MPANSERLTALRASLQAKRARAGARCAQSDEDRALGFFFVLVANVDPESQGDAGGVPLQARCPNGRRPRRIGNVRQGEADVALAGMLPMRGVERAVGPAALIPAGESRQQREKERRPLHRPFSATVTRSSAPLPRTSGAYIAWPTAGSAWNVPGASARSSYESSQMP